MYIESDRPNTPLAIYGIDFSGAVDAGRKIWISLAIINGGVLEIRDCFQACSLPNSGKRLHECLPALVKFITNHRNSIFGFDFPFGIPRVILENLGCENWLQFIFSFPNGFDDPHDFKRKCTEMAGNREAKRMTDLDSHAPFSPYNLWIFKQSYYGIKETLNPLLQQGLACVIPMQTIIDNKPLILEICPRSTLIRENMAGKKYKGRTKEHRGNRRHILDRLKDKKVIIPNGGLDRLITSDPGGDAIDSVLAAYSVWKAIDNPTFPFPKGWKKEYALEGYIYV
jgi:hypothetical protein